MNKRLLWLLLLLAGLLMLSACNDHEHTGGERCEAMAVCEICGEEYGEPAGHLYTYTSNRDTHTRKCARPGCTAPGLSEPHWGADTVCTAPGTCAACGYTYLEQGEHHFVGATCAELGKCTHCGETGGDYSEFHTFPDDADTCAICGGEYYASTLEFTLNETQDAYILSGRGTCTRTVIIVPATYQGLPVTQIGPDAFKENKFQDGGIVEVQLPASVTHIGEGAFKYCKELKDVSMPGVQEIGNEAFLWCLQLAQVCLPDTLVTIGANAFCCCTALQEVIIPPNVTEIGLGAFSSCTSMKKLELHDGIVSLGDYLVSGCTALESLYIPAGISVIPAFFAELCTALKTVTWGGEIVSIEKIAFYECEALENFDFGNALETIGDGAFESCTSLQAVQLPDTVKTIESAAFWRCTALRQLRVPSGLETVGENITLGCESLAYNIYEGMQYLGDEENPYLLFMGREDAARKDVVIHEDTRFVWPNITFVELEIESLYWGKSVESYWYYVFMCWGDLQYADTLSRIEVSPENPKYHAQGNCLIETATKTLIKGCKTSVIPADGSVTVIFNWAFVDVWTMPHMIIPDAVEEIGGNAFCGCTGLEWLVIGSGVKHIGHDILINANASVVIYYMKSAEDWENIAIVGYNHPGLGDNIELENAPRYYYSEEEPTEEGNFWHYVDGVPTPWETEA